VTKNLLSRAIPCFGKQVKPLVPAAFVVVSTHQHALGPRGGLGPFSLCVIHKEGLCTSSGDINRLMMMMMKGKERHIRRSKVLNYLKSQRKQTGGKTKKLGTTWVSRRNI
jgi:hypothetical protein